MKKNSLIGASYNAVVTAVKKDRVIFTIERVLKTKEGLKSIEEKAAYFVHGEKINLHQIFSKGETVPVQILKICHPPKDSNWLTFIVRPEVLPADTYVQDHPVGTMAIGIIAAINGATMTIRLDKNVYALTKRNKHARTGNKVSCKIDGFRKGKLSVRIF